MFFKILLTQQTADKFTHIYSQSLKTAENAGMLFIAALKFQLWSHVIDMIGAVCV